MMGKTRSKRKGKAQRQDDNYAKMDTFAQLFQWQGIAESFSATAQKLFLPAA